MKNIDLITSLKNAPKDAKVYIGNDLLEEKDSMRIMNLEGITSVDYFEKVFSCRSNLPIVKSLMNNLIVFQSLRGVKETLTVNKVLKIVEQAENGNTYSGILEEQGDILNFSLYDIDEAVLLEKMFNSIDYYGNDLIEMNNVFIIVKDV